MGPDNCSWTNIPHQGKVAQASGIGLKGQRVVSAQWGLQGPSRVHTQPARHLSQSPSASQKNTLILSCQEQRSRRPDFGLGCGRVSQRKVSDLTPRPQWEMATATTMGTRGLTCPGSLGLCPQATLHTGSFYRKHLSPGRKARRRQAGPHMRCRQTFMRSQWNQPRGSTEPWTRWRGSGPASLRPWAGSARARGAQGAGRAVLH